MTGELSPRAPAGVLRSGAERVHLAEALYVRMFALTGLTALGGAGMTVALGLPGAGAPRATTVAAAVGAAALGIAALWRGAAAYLALRASLRARVAVAAFAAFAMLGNGVDGPAWWAALALLLMLAVVGSARFVSAVALVAPAAFVGGALLAGGSLARHGADAGVLAGTAGLAGVPLLGRALCDGFARLMLLSEPRYPLRRAPLRVENLAAGAPPAAASPARRRCSGPLTFRQLEVALLACDGLRLPEIAAALAISVTQVERHLRDARHRVGAANTNQLLAIVVRDRLELEPER